MNTLQKTRDIDRVLLLTVMFDLGIVPMETTRVDMRKALDQMSHADARRARRKFRKLWRTQAKKQRAVNQTDKFEWHFLRRSAARDAHDCGLGVKTPSRKQFHERKQLVAQHVRETMIQPLILQFDRKTENSDMAK